jgi:AcrR family transcriptional regulator
MTKSDSKRSKSDWLDFALSVLVDKGPDALKIEPLCKLKGVSKGSFYHHFKNRADFIDQLMLYWFEKMTINFIAQANLQSSPIERLEKLDKIICGSNIEAEIHIRAWALKEPKIALHLGNIDAQRQQYLANCYIDLGMPTETANDVAIMAYSSFLGLQQIYPKPSIATVLRISAMGSKAFIEGINL